MTPECSALWTCNWRLGKSFNMKRGAFFYERVFPASEKSTPELQFNVYVSFGLQSSFIIIPFKNVVIYYDMLRKDF